MTMLLSKIVFSFRFLYPPWRKQTQVMGQTKHVLGLAQVNQSGWRETAVWWGPPMGSFEQCVLICFLHCLHSLDFPLESGRSLFWLLVAQSEHTNTSSSKAFTPPSCFWKAWKTPVSMLWLWQWFSAPKSYERQKPGPSGPFSKCSDFLIISKFFCRKGDRGPSRGCHQLAGMPGIWLSSPLQCRKRTDGLCGSS